MKSDMVSQSSVADDKVAALPSIVLQEILPSRHRTVVVFVLKHNAANTNVK